MSAAHERDLAHEADMRALMRQQLRDNISVEEANDDYEERERNATGIYDVDDLSESEWEEYEADRAVQYAAYHS